MKELLDDLNIRCEYDVPLGPRTWYGVGGRAAAVAHPASTAQLGALVTRCREHGVRVYTLGAGANLLVRDEGVSGVVIQFDEPGFSQVSYDGPRVTVGSGYDLMRLVLETARKGLAGLEAVAGIPATVGGAVRMNAGGGYGEIGSCVRRVQVMSESGQVYYRDRDDLVFSYRKSNIVAPFILEVEFELEEQDADELMRHVKEIFFFKKSSQPMGERSAGCAFKNPPGEVGKAAGQLIDEAGLKGFRIGSAHVSEVHANFVVADRDATSADDIVAVIEHVQGEVERRFGVRLQREVVIWP